MGFLTLLDIRTAIRDDLGEPISLESTGATFWTKEELNRRINHELRDFSFKAHCVEKTWEMPTVSGTQSYVIPKTALTDGIVYVEYRESDDTIHPLDYEDHRILRGWGIDDDGIPSFWTLWRCCIYLWPIPDAAGSLRVRGFAVAEPLVDDTDGLELPDEAANGIIHGAVYWAMVKDQNPERMDHLSARNAAIDDVNLAFRMRQRQTPHRMQSDTNFRPPERFLWKE